MKREQVIQTILKNVSSKKNREKGTAFAPINIALCKYWGKRDLELHLPMTSSLSITIPDYGTQTEISLHSKEHEFFFHGEKFSLENPMFQRAASFLKPFSELTGSYFSIKTENNIPHSAGLASSASAFAALVLALNDLLGWSLTKPQLSILARLGSGSACRSLWNGFVEWQMGADPLGFDSHGVFLTEAFPNLSMGLVMLQDQQKPMSSSAAMKKTVETSVLYRAWPAQVEQDLARLKSAIEKQDLIALGQTAEQNALAMHATMLAASPSICYFLPETLATMQRVWKLRTEGMRVFFTEDAGPNLKLIVHREDRAAVSAALPDVQWIL